VGASADDVSSLSSLGGVYGPSTPPPMHFHPGWSGLARVLATEDDEGNPTHDDSPVAIQGPITRAHAHQLQYLVKSFLSSTP
jgi:hypothetical protein